MIDGSMCFFFLELASHFEGIFINIKEREQGRVPTNNVTWSDWRWEICLEIQIFAMSSTFNSHKTCNCIIRKHILLFVLKCIKYPGYFLVDLYMDWIKRAWELIFAFHFYSVYTLESKGHFRGKVLVTNACIHGRTWGWQKQNLKGDLHSMTLSQRQAYNRPTARIVSGKSNLQPAYDSPVRHKRCRRILNMF